MLLRFDVGDGSDWRLGHLNCYDANDTLIWSLVVFQTWFDLYVDGIPRNSQPAVSAA